MTKIEKKFTYTYTHRSNYLNPIVHASNAFSIYSSRSNHDFHTSQLQEMGSCSLDIIHSQRLVCLLEHEVIRSYYEVMIVHSLIVHFNSCHRNFHKINDLTAIYQSDNCVITRSQQLIDELFKQSQKIVKSEFISMI